MTAEKHDSMAGGSAKRAQPPVVPERRTFFGVVIGLITAGIAGLLGVTNWRPLEQLSAQPGEPPSRSPQSLEQCHLGHLGDPAHASLCDCFPEPPVIHCVKQQQPQQRRRVSRVSSSSAAFCSFAASFQPRGSNCGPP